MATGESRADAEARRIGFDPAEMVKLPDPGSYVPRRGTGCNCGATRFDVTRHWREVKGEDGVMRRWQTVDAHCPACKLLSDRTSKRKVKLGTLDLATGILAIDAKED